MGLVIENVLKRPIITEKSTSQAGALKKFTFEIAREANKNHVKEAFALLFPNMEVLKVNICRIYGGSKRSIKGRTQPKDSKKAIVTVKDGHISYFPEV
jgi:large subunit ribosomal protein L23